MSTDKAKDGQEKWLEYQRDTVQITMVQTLRNAVYHWYAIVILHAVIAEYSSKGAT
jgi:hypothetical protein